MCKLTSLIVLITVVAAGVGARHLHPKNDRVYYMTWKDLSEVVKSHESDRMPIEVMIKPTRFVPINNKMSFASYEPCEDGFKRDLLGVCREVW